MKITKFVVLVLLVVGLSACSSKARKMNSDAAAAAGSAEAGAVAVDAAVAKKEVTVMDIQEALNAKGATLKADGKMGKGTRRAVREYQKKNKLKVTGNADEATLNSLGLR